MNCLRSRVYYNIVNGEVLCITHDESYNIDGVIIPTLQEDKENYPILTTISSDNLGMIELEFGKLFDVLTKAKSYVVNTGQAEHTFEVNYYSDEELKAKELIVIENVNTDRITTISDYLFEQTSDSISSIEDYILQTELNKTMEGLI